jgi:1-acyl-sn-glycerol-3-phosphate acyltransferase
VTITAAHARPSETQLDTLTRLNANDLVTAFRLDRLERIRPLVDALARIPARRFSRQILEFDQVVGQHGLAAGGQVILKLFARSTSIVGSENIPATGPLLILSNHAGMADVMALWVGLAQRPDLKIIAAERELLHAVPNVSQYLLYVHPETGGRTGMLRSAAAHLAQGGALLTFPAGRIEPDPAVYPNAADSLQHWSRSALLLARMVPETQVIPAAVAGVISASALRNPILRLFQEQKHRDWAAATLQVLIPAYRDVHTRVHFGKPSTARHLIESDPIEAMHVITNAMRVLLQEVAQQ